MRKETKIERLEQMIRVLKTLPKHEKEKHFNMACWGEITECGTTHCAAGFCGLDPWFRSRGLRMEFKKTLIMERAGEQGRLEADMTYRGFSSWNAIREFFGLKDSSDIFQDPDTIPEVIAAARKKIRELRK